MDTLTRHPNLEFHGADLREFLPPENPLPMSKAQLGGFRKDASRSNPGSGLLALRRAGIFIGTAALTSAGCYEMYEVLQVGGVTVLEWLVLMLFVVLFAWIAFSFMSALAGFAVLLVPTNDPLGIEPDAPLPSIGSRNAMLLPIYNEDPFRIMARLRAMHEIDRSIRTWFELRLVCAQRHHRSIDMGRGRAIFPANSVRISRRATSTTATVGKTPLANPAISKTGSRGSARAMTI